MATYIGMGGGGGAGGLSNPMTTAGDVITGGASGAAQRLAVGAEGAVLSVSSGAPAWVAASSPLAASFFWQVMPEIPTGQRAGPAASDDDYIVIPGNLDADGTANEIYVFDRAIGAWKTATATSNYSAYGRGVCSIGSNQFLIVGGYIGGNKAYVEIYDAAADTVTNLTGTDPLNSGLYLPRVVFDGTYAWVVEGYNGANSQPIAVMSRFNPSASAGSKWDHSSWAAKPTATKNGVAVHIGGKIWCLGGAADVIEVYDIATNTWDDTSYTSPGNIQSLPGGAFGGRIYYTPTAITAAATWRMYDTATDTYYDLQDLPADRRYAHDCVTSDGEAWVMGGATAANDYQSTAWRMLLA